jgi:ATP-dependent RNA helicase DDX27
MAALKRFREGEIEFLIATDLASRGLDIRGIENVINFEMPKSLDIYLCVRSTSMALLTCCARHRVGRTARAGKTGRSLTLVGESDRRIVKQAIKKAKSVKQRKIDAEHVKQAADDIEALADKMEEAVQTEKEDKEVRWMRRRSSCL